MGQYHATRGALTLSKSRLTAKVHHFRLKGIVPPIFLPSFGGHREYRVALGFAGTRVRRMRMPADEGGK
jgi:hypothetical protein